MKILVGLMQKRVLIIAVTLSFSGITVGGTLWFNGVLCDMISVIAAGGAVSPLIIWNILPI